MNIKPITPKEAATFNNNNFPDFVIESFNTLISQNFRHGESSFKQKDILALIVKKSGNLQMSSQMIIDHHWLDVEPIYEKSGWEVIYDEPAYYKIYPATFTFKIK